MPSSRSFPERYGDGPHAEGSRGEWSPAAALSVLVVDDSFFMRTLVTDVVRSVPEVSDVITAGSGSDAIRAVWETGPDCVLLDLMMPGMDGLTTLRHIMAVARRR